jgi:signal transduction histidine kinase
VLHEFLATNRADLINRCRLKVAQRDSSKVTDAEVAHGIPLFLDQLIKTLQVERSSEPMRSRRVSGPAGGGELALSEIGSTAALHGRELLKRGFTVDQVVHDYGDLCQAITDLAFERGVPIGIDEFRTLNRCLDNGIADAVTEYAYQKDAAAKAEAKGALNERLGSLAHELRDLVHRATLALTAIKGGKVGLEGATGALLDRALIGLRNLIDGMLADVRTSARLPAQRCVISLSDLVTEAAVSAALEAHSRNCGFTVFDVDKSLGLDVDRDMLLSAVGNLLNNAFKFTAPGTEVSLSAYAAADRIRIDVEDHCGGLPAGAAEKIFLPFVQSGLDKSGLGLGLAICRRNVEANNGVLRVRDIPGSGCVFSIDLPRHPLPSD